MKQLIHTYLQPLLHRRYRSFHIMVILVIIATLPLTVFLAKRQEQLNQHASTSGNQYYFDCSGSDNNAGTQTSPWKSLSKANSLALYPGDSMLFKRGCTWDGMLKLSRSGTSSSPIFVGAYGTGNLPIIQYGTSGYDIVQLYGSYITVDSIHANALAPKTDTNCKNNSVGFLVDFSFETGAHNDIIQNSLGTNGESGVFVRDGASYNKILHNQFLNNNMMSVLTGGGNDDSGAFGIQLHGDNTTISWNQIDGSVACSYDYGQDGSAVELYGGQNNIIDHNTARNDDAFSELGNSRSANNIYAYNEYYADSSVTNSVFLNTRGAQSSLGPIYGTKAYNNTAYLTGSGSQGVICGSGCTSSILTMRNNIMQAVYKSIVTDGQFDEDYDLFYGGPAQYKYLGSHSITGQNPQFVSTSTANFHLQATSPAINKGTFLNQSYTTTDLDENSVPMGSSPDMGGYEYGSTSSASPTPTATAAAPTNTPIPAPTSTQSTSNMLINGSFNNTGTSWLNPWILVKYNQTNQSTMYHVSSSGNVKDGAYAAEIGVTGSDGVDWHVQLQQPNLVLTQGHSYTIAFWAKSTSNRSMTVAVDQNSSPYTAYFSRSVLLSPTWTYYSYSFTPTSSTSNAFLAFNAGNSNYDVYLDAVSLR